MIVLIETQSGFVRQLTQSVYFMGEMEGFTLLADLACILTILEQERAADLLYDGVPIRGATMQATHQTQAGQMRNG
jgi:hypothetical protein